MRVLGDRSGDDTVRGIGDIAQPVRRYNDIQSLGDAAKPEDPEFGALSGQISGEGNNLTAFTKDSTVNEPQLAGAKPGLDQIAGLQVALRAHGGGADCTRRARAGAGRSRGAA